MNQELSAPPPGVGIKVVKSSPEQLVIAIPPGGKKARSIGCFGFAWMAIVLPISCAFIIGGAEDENGNAVSLLVLIPFLGIFWAVGIGMIVVWARMRFTEIFLSVEREQFAIQKTLFGRKKLKKIALDDVSQARLVESYQENDVPVYAIQMEGIGETEKFATGLSYEEKRWLANAINRFLGVGGASKAGSADSATLPEFCDDCGSELMIGEGKRVCPDCARVYLEDNVKEDEEDEVYDIDPDSRRGRSAAAFRGSNGKITERPPALTPYELPEGSLVRIDLDDGESLTFSYRVQSPLIVNVFLGGFLCFFCLFWYGVSLPAFFAALLSDEPIVMKIVGTLFASVFLVVGLMPLGMLLTLFFGRARLQMRREDVTGSIGFWLLRKKKTISTESITDVGLAALQVSRKGAVQTSGQFAGMQACMIKSSEFNMPLTMSADAQFNAQVAGLARFQFERLGVKLAND
tara:strand:- start:193597 stop:194982 length:1386 start_codon:yes stop_codon:yes gene_type:complete